MANFQINSPVRSALDAARVCAYICEKYRVSCEYAYI